MVRAGRRTEQQGIRQRSSLSSLIHCLHNCNNNGPIGWGKPAIIVATFPTVLTASEIIVNALLKLFLFIPWWLLTETTSKMQIKLSRAWQS